MHLYRLDATAEIAAQALGADAGRDPGPAAMSPPDARRRWSSATEARRAARGCAPSCGLPPPPRGDQPVTTVRNLSGFWIGAAPPQAAA